MLRWDAVRPFYLRLLTPHANIAAMKNSNDALKQYAALRDAIFAEREQLIARLREMDEALGAMGLRGRDSYYGPRTPTGRVRNEMSLKDAVLKVIDGKSL